MRRDSPQEYERLKREGYIKGVSVDRPAVISLNMAAASAAVNEFLACNVGRFLRFKAPDFPRFFLVV